MTEIITRQKIDIDMEYEILGSMIVSRETLAAAYTRYLAGELKRSHFSKYYRPVFDILLEWYGKHKNNPDSAIQKVFTASKNLFNEQALELIEASIDRLVEEYSQSDTETTYVCNEMLPLFIREREIKERSEALQASIERGDYASAEQVISSYQPVLADMEDEDIGNFGTIAPFTIEDIEDGFASLNTVDSIAYNFPGDLGRMTGPLRKTWLVAITGVEKGGKSFVLNEISYDAALNQNQKVLYINIELAKPLARQRNYRRISRTGTLKSIHNNILGEYLIIPIFDCMNNQRNTCGVRAKQPNKRPLVTGGEVSPSSYTARPNWRVCTRCRFLGPAGTKKTERFIPSIWFVRGQKIRPTIKRRVLKAIKKIGSDKLENFRVRCFPNYSVTFEECENYIERYIAENNWHPDIIVFDYLDILYEDEKRDHRLNVDENWKKAKRMAAKMNCLVLTADQVVKGERSAYRLGPMSTSESKTKDAHLDIRIGLNTTEEEKAMGVCRANVIFHRHEQYDIRQDVLLTQRLETSEPYMDTHYAEGWEKHYCSISR